MTQPDVRLGVQMESNLLGHANHLLEVGRCDMSDWFHQQELTFVHQNA